MNRGGILAEAFAFVLVAPEIIGIERLRGVEDRLERLLRRAPPRPKLSISSGFRQLPVFWPLIEPSSTNPVLATIAAVLGFAAVVIFFSALAVWDVLPTVVAAPVVAAIGVSSFVNMILSLMASLDLRPPTTSRLHRAVTIAAVPAWVTMAATVTLVYLVLVAPFLTATKVLEGPDRLRALVFGTGVVLLFGGMAAQFAATF